MMMLALLGIVAYFAYADEGWKAPVYSAFMLSARRSVT